MKALATIGYEKATVDEVIVRLKRLNIAVVIDVRVVAASRRPGFSKTMLASSLASADVDYVHLRDLGTPKAGREAARAGRIDDMRALFIGHLEEPRAQAQLAEAVRIAAKRPAALLCYEAEASRCHRALIADRIAARLGCAVLDI